MYVLVVLAFYVAEMCECITYNNTYNRTAMAELFPGFGTEWIWFPDKDENPQIVYLTEDHRNADVVSDRIFGPDDVSNDVFYWLYTRENPSKTNILMSDDSLSQSTFDPSKDTKIITHGYFSSGEADTCQTIKNEFLKKYDANVFILDWSNLSGGFYPVTAGYPQQIGVFNGGFVNFLVSKGTDPKKIHLVGHSLGAHLSGFTGKTAASGGNKIGRITGLDPAGVLFSRATSNERLSSGDADFVDVIHTCGGALGLLSPVGDVDFYPNSGLPAQPGCSSIFMIIESCSHGRSWKFFAESIASGTPFMAYKCESWVDYLRNGNCTGAPVAMGDPVSSTATGIYFLKTREEPPFAMGWDPKFDNENYLF